MERVASKITPVALGRRAVATAIRRGGFTLIEMLVVIGIILLLMTIGVAGYRSMQGSANERSTKANLTGADALLKQLTAVGALTQLEGPNDYQPTPAYAIGDKVNAVPTIDKNAALVLCRKATVIMQRRPDIKKAIETLPPAMLYTAPTGGPTTDAPAFLDGWGNVIIFVPSGGLENVTLETGATVTVTSSGTPNSPQNRPFWVSPGPDGKYETNQDNIYSFQAK